MQVNIYEAKAQLSALVATAESGEPVLIARAGKPVARLIAINTDATAGNGVAFGGLNAGSVGLSDDFHAPSTDDDLLRFDDAG